MTALSLPGAGCATGRRSARPAHPARPARPVRRAAPAGELRLTRRGRVVVTLLLLGAVLVLVTVFGGQSAATREPGAVVPTRTVVVKPGDTLWAIAAEVAGPGEVREVVHRIQRLNALPGPELTEGQELAVPLR